MRLIDLQTIRAERNLTQQQLAELTGYPQGFISKMERKKAACPEAFILKLQTVLDLKDVDPYITYEDREPQQSHTITGSAGIVGNNNDHNTIGDQGTIDKLFEIIHTRDERIAKLEADNDRLREQLMQMLMKGR